jgi:hypothetical protein
MKYVLSDIDGFVTDIKTWTPEEHALLDPATQAQYAVHEDSEDIQIGYKALDDGTFLSIEQQRDISFTEDPIAYKERLCDLLDEQLSAVMTHGFEYQGKRYKGDEKSQLWANAYLTMIMAGKMTSIGWIAQDNTVTQMTADEFGMFLNAFLSWGQTTVFTFFNAKVQIRGATTRTSADTLFEAAPKP